MFLCVYRVGLSTEPTEPDRTKMNRPFSVWFRFYVLPVVGFWVGLIQFRFMFFVKSVIGSGRFSSVRVGYGPVLNPSMECVYLIVFVGYIFWGVFGLLITSSL